MKSFLKTMETIGEARMQAAIGSEMIGRDIRAYIYQQYCRTKKYVIGKLPKKAPPPGKNPWM